LVRAVALPTALILVLLAAVVAEILQFSTSRSDQLALARQYQRVNVAMEQSMLAIATDQEASTYWDDAVIRTRQRPLDLEWIDNNLGVWFNTYYHFDEAYLLDPHDSPIYAMQNGHRTVPTSFNRVQDAALGLASRLRRRMAESYLAPAGSAGRTVGELEIAVVAGRPAVVSVKPIVSETGNIAQRARSEYLHVAVRYLDGTFLQRTARVYGLDGPRFTWAKPITPSIALQRSDGRVVGYIAWTPFQPGKEVAEHMVPVLLLALFVTGVLMSLLLLRIRRSRNELEVSRAHAERLAFHDSLTGLPNRALFDDRLKHALSRRTGNAAVLLLDLDRFKHVNDTLGHQAGDTLIREFGKRLTSLTRECDTIARLGGDEFAILIEDAKRSIIRRLAKRIVEDIRRPFVVAGAQAHVGVSVGIAISTDCGNDPQELVRKADIALYSAKDGGRNAYRLFSPEMDHSVKLRGTIEEELRHAVTSGEGLCLHYQPQVAFDGSVLGVEALLRWEHASRGFVAPQDFIPVAEETGLIVPLGEWVLRNAFAASRQWRDLFMAVNLSPIQFRSADFLNRVKRIVAETGAEPHKIQLEVTERVLLDDDESIQTILAELRAIGFKIVLDDFGTGYSSLSYLRKFEVDKIKIDRSFVTHLEDSADTRAIVAAVLALGQAMRLTVAAEGVETAEQRTFLKLAGCNEMQGHFFAPALPVESIRTLLANGHSTSAAA
jgi:diguanylate cyclase (GGDEF)-like protein